MKNEKAISPQQCQTLLHWFSEFEEVVDFIQSKLAEAWCQEVEKRTNGQVVVEYFPGQTLTKARQVYDGVVEGSDTLL